MPCLSGCFLMSRTATDSQDKGDRGRQKKHSEQSKIAGRDGPARAAHRKQHPHEGVLPDGLIWPRRYGSACPARSPRSVVRQSPARTQHLPPFFVVGSIEWSLRDDEDRRREAIALPPLFVPRNLGKRTASLVARPSQTCPRRSVQSWSAVACRPFPGAVNFTSSSRPPSGVMRGSALPAGGKLIKCDSSRALGLKTRPEWAIIRP